MRQVPDPTQTHLELAEATLSKLQDALDGVRGEAALPAVMALALSAFAQLAPDEAAFCGLAQAFAETLGDSEHLAETSAERGCGDVAHHVH